MKASVKPSVKAEENQFTPTKDCVDVSVEVLPRELPRKTSVEVTSTEASSASMKASMEAMKASVEAVEASMEATEASTEAFISFHRNGI